MRSDHILLAQAAVLIEKSPSFVYFQVILSLISLIGIGTRERLSITELSIS